MTSEQAKTEIARRLENKKITSSRKGSSGSSIMKGLSLRRSDTCSTVNGSPSQEVLNEVLEEVAEEGSLSLLKAVVSMGADPAGRTKKTKHEALSKATAAGHARIVDYLLRNGAKYGEVRLKVKYTPTDYALLSAAYKGHAELASCLIASHGANPLTEQWPREIEDTQHYWAQSQVRVPKLSVLEGISRWKNAEDGMSVLKFIMGSSRFDPTILVSGLFDSKSELQSANYQHRPWQMTYESSALACFVTAGWADTVEEMLALKGAPKEYEKEDDVQQHQEKKTRFVSPINALTNETWQKRPEDALRILHLLVDRGFDLCLAQRTPADLGKRTALGRAIAADAAQAVELILQHKPALVREEIFFRRNKRETKGLPFVVALASDRLEVARVLLRSGAHPRDPAIEDMNILQFAASESGEAATTMLRDMLPMAPELTYEALELAIKRNNKSNVRVLLDFISAAAIRGEIVALPPAYDSILLCMDTDKDVETKFRYASLIDMVYQWDAGRALYRPQLPSILNAIRKDNYAGIEKLMQLGIIDGKSLVLNSKARPIGESGEWTVLECCEMTRRSSDWLALLRYHGAPLYE
jgi:ankyrin repeat protein